VTAYCLRERDADTEQDLPFLVAEDASLAEALELARLLRRTVSVYRNGEYLVSYCGGSPYWWAPGELMHQVSRHGWCHDCHSDRLGYVHHLAEEIELEVLAAEAREDQVLRRECEANGLSPEQYAQSVAGRAVPLDGDHSFVIGVRELGPDADPLTRGGLVTWFAVDMWDMTTRKIRVDPLDRIEGTMAEHAARRAEEIAYAAQPERCYDCKGRDGRHASDCAETRVREFTEKYGE
jgi:hypothetical protein